MLNSRLWIGLVPLALLWGVAASWETPNLEKDISARALAQTRLTLPEAKVQVDGRDVSLIGQVSADGSTQQVIAQLREVEGVRLLHASVEGRRVARPFVFLAERLPGRVLLEGAAPTRAIATQLAEIARAAQPELEVVDRTGLAAGQPDNFAAIAAHGVDLVSRLSRGRFILSDASYSLQGEAADAASRKIVLDALRSLPPGARPDQIHIRPLLASPFFWSARQTGSELLLRGYAPSENAKLRVAAKAATVAKALDETELALGVSEDVFERMAGAALLALAQLVDGRAEFVGSRLSIAGVSRGALSVEEIGEQARRALPDAVALDVSALRSLRAAPYVLIVTRTPGALSLSGFAPDGPARDDVLASARGAAPAVQGALSIATGSPDGLDYGAAAKFAIAQAVNLTSGVVTLRDGELLIDGVAAPATNGDIRAAMLGPLPAGLTAGRVSLRALDGADAGASPVAPPAVPAATRPDAPLVMVAPPAPISLALVPQVAAPKIPNSVAATQAPGMSAETAAAAPSAPTLASGAPTEEASSPIPIGVGRSRAGRGAPARRDPCAARSDGLLLQSFILFDNARGLPREDQAQKLRNIFAVAKDCGPVAVEVAGHTDQVGSRVSNLVLSQIRVAVVIRLLREAGVPMGRVREAALGETAPAIPFEATERDRANNRRVTVTIRRVRR